MAFSVHRFRRVFSTSSTTRRCFSIPSSVYNDHMKTIKNALSPAVLPLETFFLSPTGTRHPSIRSTGFFLEPNLIATSASAVGRLATSYEPQKVGEPNRFSHGRILHKPDIGSTVALTVDGIILETKPLAVSFSNDLAVLKVAKPEGGFFPNRGLASSVPREDDVLTAISHRPNFESVVLMGKVRATGERTIRAKAPWPLDDRSEWIEHDWFDLGNPPPLFCFNCRENLTVTKSGTGIPWFNIYGEIIGIASWQVEDESSSCKVGFTVPSAVIRSVLEYAKTKGPDDPLVMDSWVSARVGPARARSSS